VSLNRPDTHNAFNELVIGEITDAFRAIQRDAAQQKVTTSSAAPTLTAGGFLIVVLCSFAWWCVWGISFVPSC
jgi:methylglutaconyl-CoA hydratase